MMSRYFQAILTPHVTYCHILKNPSQNDVTCVDPPLKSLAAHQCAISLILFSASELFKADRNCTVSAKNN